MAGMYPKNQTLELFGEPVSWPGVDHKGKFTNGSFSDPAVRPSFIPAETINLIIDNLSELLVSLGKTPNNQDADQLAVAIKNVFATKEQVNQKANIDSPTFTGIPKVPEKTAAATSDGTLIATEAQVKAVADTITALGGISFETLYPVGTGIVVYPNDETPAERGLPGAWTDWTDRAEFYGLHTVNPAAVGIRRYTAGITYSQNEYVQYEVPDTHRIIVVRAKGQITNAPAQLDPVKWYFQDDSSTVYDRRYTYVRRRDIQPNEWGPGTDKGFGDSVIYNGQQYYVHEVITMAGVFPSFAGGNRPPFISGGIAGDMIRNIIGGINFNGGVINASTGAFTMSGPGNQAQLVGQNGNFYITFNPSLVVPTGPEDSPITFSVKFWRRVV